MQLLKRKRFRTGRSLLPQGPRAMSSDAGTSILEEALDFIGQRIASALIQPADKDNNYIASLHNEVVSAKSERNLVN
jgi:hypothetical protein